MFPPNEDRDYYPDKYVFKTFIYIPENTMNKGINSGFYQEQYRNGYIKMTSGNVIDYDEILKEQLEFNAEHYIHTIAYDAWNSPAWSINATANALPIEPYSQSLGSFNRPTKEFERLMLSGKIIIDYNPVIRWMFSNAEIKYDSNGNIKPIKSGGTGNKIDGIISMLESLGTYLLQQPTQTGEILFA
jgi:phage terminase large subunit-like protein